MTHQGGQAWYVAVLGEAGPFDVAGSFRQARLLAEQDMNDPQVKCLEQGWWEVWDKAEADRILLVGTEAKMQEKGFIR